jgi:TPR repeat protein
MRFWPRSRAAAPPEPPSNDALLAQARAHADGGRMGEALAIWRALAEAGVARAQVNLGACCATGNGVARDPRAALLWLERGATAGDPVGQRNLATLKLRDDPAAAAIWYRKAAEQGDAVSQDQLSALLFAGEAVIQDFAEARRWAEAAAGQGIAASCARLGTMWHEAKGGPRDPAEAARWWRIAAEGGDGDGAAMLGAALHMGQGVAADQVAAMAWLILGSRRRSVLIRGFFDRVEAMLSEEQRAEAEALAERWGRGAAP